MPQMNMIQALNSAMDIMLGRDPNVVILGEDVGFFGGVFRVTDGLQRKYGEHRVLDTPIAEGAIIGAAIGMGVNGLRPVAEVQFADYIYPACDQIFSELARLRYRSAGEFWAPVTVRTPCGGGIRGGQTHSQSPEAIFTHVCGIKVVMPCNPYDAKGLLISSIEDDDPVVFFEPKRLYNGPFDGDPNKPAVPWSTHPKGEVPDGYYTVPIGKAEIVRKGAQLTIVTYGTMVYVCEAAARSLGLDAEIIDVRTMVPLDVDTICTSVKKTGRCLIAHEATRFSGFGAELSATIQEQCFWDSRGADPARRRLGHAVSARVRVGVFPGARARDHRPQGRDGDAMTRYVFKMPDLGEGTVEAEIVAWHVKVGEHVNEDQVMAEVMTEKAAVEVPAPVTGRVVSMTGGPGDMIRVGAELIVFETTSRPTLPASHRSLRLPTAGETGLSSGPLPLRAESPTAAAAAGEARRTRQRRGRPGGSWPRRPRGARAREAGIDLAQVGGSGRAGESRAAISKPRCPGGRSRRAGDQGCEAIRRRRASPGAPAPRRSRSSACDA